jgi:two-component system sensor histidine kinase UhpB
LLARAQASGDAEGVHDARRIADTADSLYSTTRHIVKGLRPEVIDTLGLSGAVEDLVRSFDKAQARCQFDCRAAADLPDVRGEQAMPAYRVIQEALTNVLKHSGATRASVALAVSTERDRLHIVIADNGHGFDAQVPHQTGLGLIGMRERVEAVGGDITITSSPQEGTSICVTLPMPERAAIRA